MATYSSLYTSAVNLMVSRYNNIGSIKTVTGSAGTHTMVVSANSDKVANSRNSQTVTYSQPDYAVAVAQSTLESCFQTFLSGCGIAYDATKTLTPAEISHFILVFAYFIGASSYRVTPQNVSSTTETTLTIEAGTDTKWYWASPIPSTPTLTAPSAASEVSSNYIGDSDVTNAATVLRRMITSAWQASMGTFVSNGGTPVSSCSSSSSSSSSCSSSSFFIAYMNIHN